MQKRRGPSTGNGHGTQLARGLGLFSVGLGLAEVAAPEALARLIGVEPDRRTRETMIAMGVREIASGIGILSLPRRPATAWARVVGDAIDLSLLGYALYSRRQSTTRLAVAIGAVVGVALLDVLAGRRASRRASAWTPR
jgi:hypothetical protein